MKREGTYIMEERRTNDKISWKQVIISFVFYGACFLLLLFPWVIIGEGRYNIFQLAMKMRDPGLETLAAGTESYLYMENPAAVNMGVWAEIVLYGLFFVFGLLHLVSAARRKNRWYHIAGFIAAALAFYVHVSGYTLIDVATDQTSGIIVPGVVMSLAAMELAVVKMMGVWKETRKLTKEYYEKERREKEEKRERLGFDGRYSELFYQFIWKNFKSNWKDYILLFLCGSLVFAFIVIGFGIQKLLGVNSRYEGLSQIFGGLNAILMNAILPVGVISVIIIVVLVFHYLRCRAKNYGIFLTLGMRKKTLQYFVAVEFVSLLFFTIVAGGLAGTGVLALFSMKSQDLIGQHVALSFVGIITYIKSVGVLLLLFLVSFMAARDIFVDFNMGRSTDLEAIRERMPGRFRKEFFALGVLACIYSIYEYKQLRNFESVKLLVILFVGIFFMLRFGIAEWLLRERRRRSYLRKLMIHNQLFHKSKTNTGYIFGMAMIQFCALFYFSFQAVSVEIAEDADTLYPYDIVCVADDKDDDIFNRINDKYETEMTVCPMVRVSNYDSTEKSEGARDGQPPQGQHIGISESTYHLLKGEHDKSYQAKPLHLDDEGEKVYLVHQQDKSIKAQPVEFFGSRKELLIHIGRPCPIGLDDALLARKKDVGYHYKKIEGEEIGSLTGVFRQGLRDNLIVFSDAYFEKAKELWKTTDMYTGLPIPEDEEKIEGENIRQGPSKLVLINAESEDVPDIVSDLAEFKERHREEERYDATVPCYYTKSQAVQNLKVERLMKVTMNLLVLIVSFVVYLVLLNVKMATEADMVSGRAEFLTCMGMRAGERKALIRRELMRYYYLLPTAIAAALAVIYTAAVFLARQYTKADMAHYIKVMIPLWAVSLFIVGAAVTVRVAVYIQKAEGKGE